MAQEKGINYWKNNCEEDYITTPISVLRYISELEKLVPSTQQETLYTEEQVRESLFYALNVNRKTCCTTRTTDSIVRETIQSLNVSKGNATSDFDKPFMDFAKQYFKPKKD